MAKKDITKAKNERELDDSIPLKGFHEESADMEIVLENKPDFGFVQAHAPFRNISPAVEARLKKMVERLEAKKKKP